MIGSNLGKRFCGERRSAEITGYLLNLAHLKGGSRAKFLLRSSFPSESWGKFADVLRHHAKHNPVVQIKTTFFGIPYALDCNLPTPGKSTRVFARCGKSAPTIRARA